MDSIIINGGKSLAGKIKVNGSKNATLPIMTCSLLTNQPLTILNTPDLTDIYTMKALLENHGAVITDDTGKITINSSKITGFTAPYEIVRKMRASIWVLGPLLARFGEAIVSLPGGCAIGARQVDQHIKGLQAMGAQITVEHGNIVAKAKRLKGTRITTDMVTVTGTENLLMAATLAEGLTVLENAAQEPEIPD